MIPQPSQSSTIIGHEAAKKQIEEAFNSGRMHHAWLLVGIEGLGKASLAYHIAHRILSGGANSFGRFNPEHPSARLIAAESHPDLFILRRPTDEKTGALKESIPVNEARKLEPFLRMTSSQGGGRVAIIDEAHRLNRNGQNAILKMIEEPPSGAVIILTATTAGALLPTIRSRCRVLALDPLNLPEIETILARLGAEWPPGVDKGRYVNLAGGSVGLLLKILGSDAIPLYDETLDLLKSIPDMDVPRLHRLADMLGKKADVESFQIVTTLLLEALRTGIRAIALGLRDEAGLATRLEARGRLDNALKVWENTKKTFTMADEANLDNKLAFIVAMTEMARCAA